LAVAGGVADELAQDLAGGGVGDGDLQVFDEHPDVGSGVGTADTDADGPRTDS
jgi:hypothetical protein